MIDNSIICRKRLGKINRIISELKSFIITKPSKYLPSHRYKPKSKILGYSQVIKWSYKYFRSGDKEAREPLIFVRKWARRK